MKSTFFRKRPALATKGVLPGQGAAQTIRSFTRGPIIRLSIVKALRPFGPAPNTTKTLDIPPMRIEPRQSVTSHPAVMATSPAKEALRQWNFFTIPV